MSSKKNRRRKKKSGSSSEAPSAADLGADLSELPPEEVLPPIAEPLDQGEVAGEGPLDQVSADGGAEDEWLAMDDLGPDSGSADGEDEMFALAELLEEGGEEAPADTAAEPFEEDDELFAVADLLEQDVAELGSPHVGSGAPASEFDEGEVVEEVPEPAEEEDPLDRPEEGPDFVLAEEDWDDGFLNSLDSGAGSAAEQHETGPGDSGASEFDEFILDVENEIQGAGPAEAGGLERQSGSPTDAATGDAVDELFSLEADARASEFVQDFLGDSQVDEGWDLGAGPEDEELGQTGGEPVSAVPPGLEDEEDGLPDWDGDSVEELGAPAGGGEAQGAAAADTSWLEEGDGPGPDLDWLNDEGGGGWSVSSVAPTQEEEEAEAAAAEVAPEDEPYEEMDHTAALDDDLGMDEGESDGNDFELDFSEDRGDLQLEPAEHEEHDPTGAMLAGKEGRQRSLGLVKMLAAACVIALLTFGGFLAWKKYMPAGSEVTEVASGTPDAGGDPGSGTDAAGESPDIVTPDAGTETPDTGTVPDIGTDPVPVDPGGTEVTPDADPGTEVSGDPGAGTETPVPDTDPGTEAGPVDGGPEVTPDAGTPADGAESTGPLIIETTPAVRIAPEQTPEAAARPPMPELVPNADTIVQLANGHQFRGRIKRVKGEQLTLGIERGEYTFHLSELTVLAPQSPEFRSLQELPKASVTLRNGQRLRGRLLKETADFVVLMFEQGRLTVPRVDIRSVSFSGRVHF